MHQQRDAYTGCICADGSATFSLSLGTSQALARPSAVTAFVRASVAFGSVAAVAAGAGLLTLALSLHPSGAEARLEAEDDEEEAVPIILHGRTTASDPAVVKVQRHHGRGGLGVCTGTVIAPRYVLTARHCAGSGRLEVLVGDNHPTPIAVTRAHFDRPTGRHKSSGDIAVLELAHATSVAPIRVNLDARTAMAVHEARAVGFGLTGSRTEDEKKRTIEFASRTTSEFIESEHGGVVCYGDSGGPTLAMVDGREQLVAVTSHMTSTRCTKGRVRSVRTDRHAAFLQSFIDASVPPPAEPTPQANVTPAPVQVPSSPPPQPRVSPVPRVPVAPLIPPTPPRDKIASNGNVHAHAHASSSNGRTRVSVRVDGSGAHAEAHVD